MTARLWPLVLLVALAGCGGNSSVGFGTDPTTSAPTTSAPTPSAPDDDASVVALMSGTGASGTTQPSATLLTDAAAVTAFTTPLGAGLAGRVRQAATRALATGPVVYAQVVAVRCDAPPSVSVEVDGATVTIVPAAVASPHSECFAPVTTVAVVRIVQPR